MTIIVNNIHHPPTGSLERLDYRTPPRSLKIRTFSIEEQQEQELASGTHDRRVRGALQESHLALKT